MKDYEMLQDIYKTSEMAIFSISKVLEKLEKNTKIKELLEEELKEYEKYRKTSKSKLKENKQNVKESSAITKFSSSFGITLELLKDNSDNAIASMLIKGIKMGIKEMQKKIHDYEQTVKIEIIELAKKLLDYQQDEIKKIKEYLV